MRQSTLASEDTLAHRVVRFWRAQPTSVQRQLLFALIFLVAFLGIPITGIGVASAPVLLGGVLCLLITTAGAVVIPWRTWPAASRLLIPLGSMLAVGLLRAATGESASPYGFLIILPALAVGAEARRRWPLLLVALGCAGVVILPYLVLADPAPSTSALVLRVLFIPAIATVAAIAVHELTRDVRRRMSSMRALQSEQDRLLLCAQRDAEELADSARAVRTARDTLTSVVDAVTEQSIIATDHDGLIQVFNAGAEKLLGLRRTAVVGRTQVTDFHLPQELSAVDEQGRSGFAALVAAAATGRAEVRDWTYVAADGRAVTVALAVTPRYDSHGAVLGFLFVATDMTEAREVARLKDEFVSLISHELRTPLSSVLGYLELVLDDEDSPLSAEQRQYLGIIERNANRLLHLVGDLLFTAQVEAGKFTFDEREVNLSAVITASADTAMPGAAHGGVRVQTELPELPVLVSGDGVRLGQACDNLLSNAVKFTPRGGEVCISLDVSPADSYAIVSVRDTGYGIAADEVEKLFTRFFRATTATSNAISGVGLGLAITRAIVTAHHGELDVSSVEGTGTTFSFRLPLR